MTKLEEFIREYAKLDEKISDQDIKTLLEKARFENGILMLHHCGITFHSKLIRKALENVGMLKDVKRLDLVKSNKSINSYELEDDQFKLIQNLIHQKRLKEEAAEIEEAFEKAQEDKKVNLKDIISQAENEYSADKKAQEEKIVRHNSKEDNIAKLKNRLAQMGIDYDNPENTKTKDDDGIEF